MVWGRQLAVIWLACLALVAVAAEPIALPSLQGRVTDLTGTLDATQRGRLEAHLAAIERSGRAQAALLLLPTTQPEAIEQFGIRLAEAWKLGRKGADDGLIIIVAKDDRKMRIEVGYGLEGSIPDAIAKRIIAERMAPKFKQGDFFGGLEAAVGAIDTALGGNAIGSAEPRQSPATGSPPERDMAWLGKLMFEYGIWLLFLLGFAGVLQRMLGLAGAAVAGALGGWLVFQVFEHWLGAVIGAVFFMGVSFARPSPPAVNGGRNGGGWSAGGDWSSGHSDSGSGGFSGGGGGFGGGGASGDW